MKIDNDGCSFHVVQSKYKRRRVSAVRDFPPGCGWIDPQINLRPTEDSSCTDITGNSSSEHPHALRIKEAIGTANTSELTKTNPLISGYEKDGQEKTDAESVQMQFSEALESSEDAWFTEHIITVEHKTSSVSKDLHPLDISSLKDDMVQPSSLKPCSPSNCPITIPNGIGNDLEKSVARKYPSRRRISAIRDFPLYCGTNPPRLNMEETLKVRTSQNNKGLEQEISGIDDKTSNPTVKSGVKILGDNVEEGSANWTQLRKNVSKLNVSKVEADFLMRPTKDIEAKYKFGLGNEDKRGRYARPSSGNNQYQLSSNSESSIDKTRCNLEELGKEIVIYKGDIDAEENLANTYIYQKQLQNEPFESSNLASNKVVVHGLMAAPNCPWRNEKTSHKPSPACGKSERKEKKNKSPVLKTKDAVKDYEAKFSKKKSTVSGNVASGDLCQLVIRDKDDLLECDEESDGHVAPRKRGLDVSLPPFGRSSLGGKIHEGDAIVTRIKVRETLRLYHAVCRKLLQEVEKTREQGSNTSKKVRLDLQAAKILKDKEKFVNTGKQILGPVPGVEVGDEFRYRIELNIIGLHRPTQAGIDYLKHGQKIIACSVVASGGYADDLDNSDILIYTGQGGNVMNSDKQPEDQKLERGNLALKNSFDEKNPVRVIRGFDSSDGRMYFYDGLYLVEKWWQVLGPHGKLVFRFQLNRIPGQPELALREVKKSKKFKVREGLCLDDISQGKEVIPICAVNSIDDEKPPPFKYITRMMYPDWCRPLPLEGCTCTDGCSDSEKCLCAVNNGGEIPFNHNGAIVEAKPIVYECGPSCKCPSSCYNRVTQHGIRFQLEIFKTKSRGWGVRSLNSIPSGSFICEYIGELLEEKEAEQRTGNDEYLFDIGNNYNDTSLWDGLSTLVPEAKSSSCELVGAGGFTIDAAQYGNVGRFINHSCSPNLYAQNVLYDHEDKRIPHIMFFAAENIPPLQELTYHYNYVIDQVRDSNGNIKRKSCYCGSVECTGRMY